MASHGVPVDGPRRPSPVALVALLTGLVVTTALAVTTIALYDRNEDRLLGLRAKELGLLFKTAVLPTQTELASAAALADATGGNVPRFRALLEPEVGPGRQFASASLWRLGSTHPAPITVLGGAPRLTRPQAVELFSRAAHSHSLSVLGLLQASRPSVGYALSASPSGHGFVIYAESQLAANRRSKLEKNTAFSDLDYAIYLGHSTRTRDLLVTSLRHLPIASRRASTSVSFGDRALTLVVTPRGSLGGTFFRSLPWIVVVLGVLLSIAAALLAGRLARGRRRAEQLADSLDRARGEIEQMFTEQRSIAQTLQHALLPETLPEVKGLKVSARYVAATSGVEVGGDWYDVVAAGEHRALLVIGDVSGQGLRAATTMASLRHATLAYAAHDARPAAVLARLSQYVNGASHDYFATVLCALIDVDAHRLTVASAGHLPPLLLGDGDARFLEMSPGAPIGVTGESHYEETDISVPPRAALLAFTDGLVERRGEVIDTGLARLRDAAAGQERDLEELISMLPDELAVDSHHDDTAIVGIQWQN
jgi:serine phosphatase RsbU (regulator of sigma subunit)